MKKVLIVGATSGYGHAIADALQEDAIVVGMSRSPNKDTISDRRYPLTDVTEIGLFTQELRNALEAESNIDAVAFIPGDVLLKEPSEFTVHDLRYMMDANVGYVARGFAILRNYPQVKTVLTVGSQWSYREQYDKLAAYSIAKHALKHLTARFAEDGRRALHICVPTTKTEKLEKIAPFLSGQSPSLSTTMPNWEDPRLLAPAISNALLDSSITSGTYALTRDFQRAWSLESLSTGTDSLDRAFHNLSLEQFLEPRSINELYLRLFENVTKHERVLPIDLINAQKK